MGGGLLQLVAYGAQDIYLTGNPQITFFKVVYRRHTNFSMESIEQTFNGTADFGKKVSCTISRNGDLAHRVYLQTTLPQLTATDLSGSTTAFTLDADSAVSLTKFKWVNWIGHKMIKYVEVEIGGQRIDKHYGEWLHLWNELTQTSSHENTYARMVGNVPKLTTSPVVSADTSGDLWVFPQTTLYIPLQFWFCRNPGLALPLIALQYHETKINIEFEDLANCIIAENSDSDVASSFNGDISLSNTNLWVDYIYLDTDERRRFAQMAHEYLIEQLQYSGEETATSSTNKIRLAFNHPVKEVVWITQVKSSSEAKQWYNFSMASDDSFDTGLPMDPLGMGLTSPLYHALGRYAARLRTVTDSSASGIDSSLSITFDYGQNPTSVAKLQLNGQDRFTERQGDYFNYVQPYQHHTRGPSIGINIYSFSLKPEEHQPSGTCNFSRIDTANLFLTLNTTDIRGTTQINAANPAKIRIYATNYNVLRIMSGMGGLAYSN